MTDSERTDMEDGSADRKASRNSMMLSANIESRVRVLSAVARVRNISSGGLMAESPQPFEANETVTIELRGVGIVEGTVAWVAPGKFGVAFNSPIDPQLTLKPTTQRSTTQTPAVPITNWRPGFRSR